LNDDGITIGKKFFFRFDNYLIVIKEELSLKTGIVLMLIVLMADVCASASDTTAKFQIGPLAVSMDLGVPCNDVNINKPVSGVRSGESYTEYNAIVCGNYVAFMRYDSPIIDLNQSFGTSSVRRSLLEDIGAAENTISVDEREIDGKPGAVGSGYVPKYHMTAYFASFNVSSRTVGHIGVYGNQTQMTSILKTLKVTEAT
jgi:hypothetical protein